MGWPANSRDADLTTTMLAWKVRAALRQQSRCWCHPGAINAMSRNAADPAWSTGARAAGHGRRRRQGRPPRATALLEASPAPRGFYEQLALENWAKRVTAARPRR